MNRLIKLVNDFESAIFKKSWKGAAPPEERPIIEQAYKDAKAALHSAIKELKDV